MTKEEYKQKIQDFKDFLYEDIIEVIQPGADIRKRYTTAHGQDEEKHLGFVRNENTGKADCWLLMMKTLKGLPPNDKGSMSSVDKPIRFILEHYLDYNIGTDDENSQDVFETRMITLDFLFEQKFSCLPNGFVLQSWEANAYLRRFNSATVHWLTVSIDLIANGLDF